MTMAVTGFDHVALPAANPEALIEFYRRLSFTIAGEAEWRAGTARLFSIHFGDNKINVHPPELWQRPEFTLRGPAARPGCGDFCFVWDGGLAALTALIERAGAPLEVGPVQRQGGRGLGTSVYTRDPDGNLLEFIVYD